MCKLRSTNDNVMYSILLKNYVAGRTYYYLTEISGTLSISKCFGCTVGLVICSRIIVSYTTICLCHCTHCKHCTLYTVHTHCTLYTLYTVHTVHCTYCTLYTLYTSISLGITVWLQIFTETNVCKN